MIRHLFKLVWNRKRNSGLLIVEMFFAFLILCAVATLDSYYLDNYQQPLGFSWENVWAIIVHPASEGPKGNSSIHQQLYQSLNEMAEIEAVGGADGGCAVPYSDAYCGSDTQGATYVRYSFGRANDGFATVLGVKAVQGRWFNQEDEAQNWDAVVINQRLSQTLFGTEDPVGKIIKPHEVPGQVSTEMRVVGVIEDFRKGGELAGVDNFLFGRISADSPLDLFTVKVSPGTGAEFEEKLLTRLQGMAKGWTFEVKPMGQWRASSLKWRSVPPVVAGIISVFLLLMVGLGLMGVLWQSIAQRTRELGLRRALGATGRTVRWQLVGETLAMTSIAVGFGVLVFVQFPLLGIIRGVSNTVYGYGLAVALLLIYALVLLCGFYPSRLATRVQPAEALHYE